MNGKCKTIVVVLFVTGGGMGTILVSVARSLGNNPSAIAVMPNSIMSSRQSMSGSCEDDRCCNTMDCSAGDCSDTASPEANNEMDELMVLGLRTNSAMNKNGIQKATIEKVKSPVGAAKPSDLVGRPTKMLDDTHTKIVTKM